MTNRENLEWLVYHALNELLGFKTINQMRDWDRNYNTEKYYEKYRKEWEKKHKKISKEFKKKHKNE